MGDSNHIRGDEETRGEHASTESVDIDKLLASSIKAKLCYKSPSSSRSCIFRVPQVLRRHNENTYVPKIVSIGPFHHGQESYKSMQELKLWYLHALLSRATTMSPETSLEVFIKAIRKSEGLARVCYAEPINLGDEFIEMMVIDGCFIIELFRKHKNLAPRDRDDPIFNVPWMIANLQQDLILLENQLPWFVLECLFNLTLVPGQDSPTLTQLSLHFFNNILPMTVAAKLNTSFKNKHLLDFVRNTLLSSSGKVEPEDTSNWKLIPCVTDLLEAGVKFKKGSADDILNVKFSNGVMEIPPLLIDETTEFVFRNLIAFEQCDHSCNDKITSYAVLLDCLINSSNDVDLLSHKGIIENWLSTEDVSLLFNRLYIDANIRDFYYVELCQQVNAYYRADWNKWRATLKRDYFNTPWAVLSFIAAIILLLLTFAQTIFSVLSYFPTGS